MCVCVRVLCCELVVLDNKVCVRVEYRERQEQEFYATRSSRILGKGKSVPLQSWSGPEGSRKLWFPDFMTTAQEGGKFVSTGRLYRQEM